VRREAPGGSAAVQHDASASAKRCLVKSNTLILRLEDGLKGITVGEGEIRRRRDLLSRARKEREGLETLLNAWAITRSSASTNEKTSGGTSIAGARKEELFSGAIRASPLSESPGKMPGSFPISQGRVLGGPARETEKTRDKDNQEVLMLQRQIMQEQDMDVDELAKAVRRLKELGIGINEEMVEQQQLLDILDQDVDRCVYKHHLLISVC
jgi:regulator of vacuolar morphogenesis